jgi:SAM-dependent methyltransferase
MKKWYDDDAFWDTWGPIMFSKERWEGTPEEVDNLIELLDIEPNAKVLDLCCGPGRHLLEFARRGFSVTGVDRTKRYLDQARELAEKEGLKAEFVQKDMREFRKPRTFDLAVNLLTSFGFFEDEKDDEKVAKNVFASLKEGGAFVIEMMGKEILARIFRERDWQEINGAIWMEERKVSKDWSWMENRWILLKGGQTHEFRFSLRPYSAAELTKLLTECGFAQTEVYGNLGGAPYDHEAQRLVVVAHKAKKRGA